MLLSKQVQEYLEKSSLIRKMFTEGIKLKKKYGKENVFDFSLGNPDVPAPEKIHKTLRELVKDVPKPYEHGYCPNSGLDELREKLAEIASLEQKIGVSKDDIIVTCGAAGGINVFLRAVLENSDEVITPSPYFVEYGFYVENYGGILKVVPTKENFQLDIEAIEKSITPKTKVVIINSPNNPTGQIYPEEDLKKLAELLRLKSKEYWHPIYLLSDEPYRYLSYDEDVPPILPLYEYSVVVSSFSKSLSLAGERIGYVVVSPLLKKREDLMNAMAITNRILGFVNAPILIQRALIKSLDAKIDKEIYRKRRDVFANILKNAGYEFTMPKGAFYFFVKSPIDDDFEFVKILKEELILAVPGSAFGKKGYFRISFCVDEEIIKRSEEGFKKAYQKAISKKEA